KDKRLGALLESKPTCARHFYYNAETKSFAIEDPALIYFLKHLDWDRLRIDCGFKSDSKDYEYDFAISFAGENRDLARHLAKQLEIFDASVFYDENFESNFLGKAWSAQFLRIFGNDSRLVVCLLDKHHHDKIWPTFERECFTPRVADGDVIPIYLDDTKFVGIPHDLVGIMFKSKLAGEDWKKEADDVVLKLMERVA
ncbi:MAG: TIR domain-containing protein, partial [Planctomycetaceae bacterium]|nr:TIR domain-containing protein [Planctomycetaceae bacterium]